MARITVSVDRAAVERVARDVGRQARYAAALALTRTAQAVAAAAPDEAEKQLGSLTTRYTRTGLYVERAKKDALRAVVGYKRDQAAYMVYQVEGGRRAPRKVALRLPDAVPVDVYGNVPAGTIRALRTRAQQRKGRLTQRTRQRAGAAEGETIFYGTPRGNNRWERDRHHGLWLRAGGRLRPLILFPRRSAQYRPRFAFYAWGRAHALRVMPGLFAAALREAAATAR